MTKTRDSTVSSHKQRYGKNKKWKRKGRYNRVIEYLEKQKSVESRRTVERKYKRGGYYKPSPLMAAQHGSDSQWVKQNPDNTQHHARIYDKGDHIEVEEHTDLVSPERDPIGHVAVDVVDVTVQRELMQHNENDTKIIRLKKRGKK